MAGSSQVANSLKYRKYVRANWLYLVSFDETLAMDLLNQFESEQKMLQELKDLFSFVPPGTLRRNLEDLFFLYMSCAEDPDLPDGLVKHFYFLINFLNEMEGTITN